MRLIDADVIEKFLDDFADSCGNHQKAVLREVKYALGKMPTVDAEPVKQRPKIDIERFKQEIADYTNESGYVDIPLSVLINTLNEVTE